MTSHERTGIETERGCLLGQLAALTGGYALVLLVPRLDTALTTRALLLRSSRLCVFAARVA